jgi:Flp pilus assembly protein TadD
MAMRAVLGIGALCCLVACGGAKPPAEAPTDGSGGGSTTASEPAERAVAPASSEAVKQGRDALVAKDYARAEGILKEEVKRSPKDPQAAYYLGVAYDELGKLPEAKAEYERAIGLSEQLLEARQNLSYLLLIKLDQPEAALAVAEAGLAVAPKDAPLLANKAGALDVLGRPEAVAAYRALLEVAPSDVQNRFNLAVLLAAGERPEEALSELDRLESEDAALLVDVADLYGRLGKFDRCVARLDRVATAADSTKVRVYRARCKSALGDSAGAEADLRRAVELGPEDPMGYFYLGKHLLAAKKATEGKAALRRAVELGPDTPFGKSAAEALRRAK